MSSVAVRAQRPRVGRLAGAFACLLSLLAVELIGAMPAASAERSPEVGSVRPPIGSASGATMVTIRGNGFGDATSVRFGDVEATSFNVTINVDDDTTFEGVFGDEITAVSPPHAEGSVHVTVTTPRGTSPTNDCGDSGEASAKGPPHCDRFHYYGDLRGGAWATTGVQQKGAGDEPLFLFREKTTLLLSGKVLLTGPSGAELYDPATGRWNSCPEATASADCPGPMVSARGGPHRDAFERREGPGRRW